MMTSTLRCDGATRLSHYVDMAPTTETALPSVPDPVLLADLLGFLAVAGVLTAAQADAIGDLSVSGVMRPLPSIIDAGRDRADDAGSVTAYDVIRLLTTMSMDNGRDDVGTVGQLDAVSRAVAVAAVTTVRAGVPSVLSTLSSWVVRRLAQPD